MTDKPEPILKERDENGHYRGSYPVMTERDPRAVTLHGFSFICGHCRRVTTVTERANRLVPPDGVSMRAWVWAFDAVDRAQLIDSPGVVHSIALSFDEAFKEVAVAESR